MIDQSIQTYICEIRKILHKIALLQKVQEQSRAKNWEKGWTPW